MKATVLPAGELSPELRDRWSALQGADASLDSPYFSPAFTSAVAAVRSGVFVAVLEEGSQVAGFWPFERGRLGVGRPVGGVVNDFHGVIAQAGFTFSSQRLLRSCGLVTWEFHHQLAGQSFFQADQRRVCDSYYIDLSSGYEAYVDARRAQGSTHAQRVGQKRRKLEREHGPLTFELAVHDPASLRQLLLWKAQQYYTTGVPNVFARCWTIALLEELQRRAAPDCDGVLSVLRVGGRLIAAHFGMRSEKVWHAWFPAYDPAFAAYSPGLLLFEKMAEAAPAAGLRRIDLGKGEESFKRLISTGCSQVAEGRVERNSPIALLRRGARGIREFVRRSDMYRYARPCVVGARAMYNRRFGKLAKC